jgi:hypothetical protein
MKAFGLKKTDARYEVDKAALGAVLSLATKRFRRPNKPKSGEHVLWIWADAGQVTVGDYYGGRPRDASKNYELVG